MNSLVSILQEPWVLQAFGLSIYQSLDEDLVRAQYPFIIFIVLHTPRSSSDLPKLSGTWTYYLEQRLQDAGPFQLAAGQTWGQTWRHPNSALTKRFKSALQCSEP